MAHTRTEIVKNWLNPDFKFFINREGSISGRKDFLLRERRMEGEYLGACLDYVRWGGHSTVMYEMGSRGLIEFIGAWMSVNEGEFLWHEDPLSEDLDLPRLNRDSCSTRGHESVVKDRVGRKRCGNANCYSLLSDEGVVLPLEEVLDRLNLQRGKIYCAEIDRTSFSDPCRRLKEVPDKDKATYKKNCSGHPPAITVHPFSGWTLAHYVQRWYEQQENAPLFNQ